MVFVKSALQEVSFQAFVSPFSTHAWQWPAELYVFTKLSDMQITREGSVVAMQPVGTLSVHCPATQLLLLGQALLQLPQWAMSVR